MVTYILVLFEVLVVQYQLAAFIFIFAVNAILCKHNSVELLYSVGQSLCVAKFADGVFVSHCAALTEQDLAVIAEIRLDDEPLA